MFKNSLLLIISISIVFIFLEIALSLFYPQNIDGWYATRDQSGLNILKKNLTYYHRINNRNIKYTFGKFNNRDTIYKSFTTDKEKILILGDSFTFGWLINDKNIYVNYLQEYYENYYFLNPSVPGWGTSDYLRYIENYCNTISPKKIIVMLNTDDIARSWLSKLYNFKINDLNNLSSNSISLGYEKQLDTSSKFHKIPFYRFLIKNSHLFVFLRQIIVDIKDGNFNYFDEIDSENEKFEVAGQYLPTQVDDAVTLGKMLFLRIKKLSNECGSDLMVIYSGWFDYDESGWSNYNEKDRERLNTNPTFKFLRQASVFFKKQNIEYYDLVKKMGIVHQNFNDYLIIGDGHPNEAGHKIIAEKIIENVDFN